MKLFEITDDNKSDVEVVKDYIVNYVHHETTLRPAVNNLIANPKYQYQGEMVRFIIIEGVEFIKRPDMKNMLSTLQRFDQKYKRGYFSWTDSLSRLQNILHNNYNADMYDDFEYPVGIIISQNGIALDTHTLPIEIPAAYEDERELLAPLYNNVHVVGFYDATKFYPLDNFQEFVKEVKSSIKK
jgi:hypothetical protein